MIIMGYENRIGRYNGIVCYKSIRAEYISKGYYKDTESIFVIDSKLIFKNKVIGEFDGNWVKEYNPWEQYIYYNIPATVEITAARDINEVTSYKRTYTMDILKDEAKTASTIDFSEIYGTDYSEYTVEVDKFMEKITNG